MALGRRSELTRPEAHWHFGVDAKWEHLHGQVTRTATAVTVVVVGCPSTGEGNPGACRCFALRRILGTLVTQRTLALWPAEGPTERESHGSTERGLSGEDHRVLFLSLVIYSFLKIFWEHKMSS